MDKDKLSKDKFIELVDKMLDIIYNNTISQDKQENDLISEVCNNIFNTTFILNNPKNTTIKYNIIKILPCNNEKSIINKNITLSEKVNGGASTGIYNNIIPGKKFKYTTSPDKNRVLFGYFFEYYLYKLINKPNYLCKNDEIGKLIDKVNKESYPYSIMNDCGKDIIKFFTKENSSSNKTIINTYKDKDNAERYILFNNLLIIFYKMITCVKILHDLGYAHLDIKPENFLISTRDNSNLLDIIFTKNIEDIVLIKIIDFELVRKIGSKINMKEAIGTFAYAHNNLLKTNSTEITISPIYDIVSLRKSFIYIIGIIFFDSKIYEENKSKKDPEKFNEQIDKILAALNGLTNKPTKLDSLLIILDNITKNTYINIDFLLNAFYCLLYIVPKDRLNFGTRFLSSNVSITNKIITNSLSTPNSEITFIPISDYYYSFYYTELLNKYKREDIPGNIKIKINTDTILDIENEKRLDLVKLNNKIHDLLNKYLLPPKDIITGYKIDDKLTKITYFRKIKHTAEYIPLKTYFERVIRDKDNNEYIIFTHILYIFSSIMQCIELFEYLPNYGLNVLLDNFVIKNNTTLFTLDIDLKIVGGIVNMKIYTTTIETLGICMTDILNKFEFFKTAPNNNKNIYNQLKELINNNKIDIEKLIFNFREINKTIYLEKILKDYDKISNKATKINGTKDKVNIFKRNIEDKSNKSIIELNKTDGLKNIIFAFLFYNYIYYFQKSKIEYLCYIESIYYEKTKYYKLIKNDCGIKLTDFFKKININSSNKKIILNNILKIFYEMILCIEILHENGFYCKELKTDIFFISQKKNKTNKEYNENNNFLIKIIDFSSIKIISYSEFKIKDYIETLGNIFINVLNKDIHLNDKSITDKGINKGDYEKFKTIVDKMCNSGYYNINDLITDFQYLFKTKNENIKNKNEIKEIGDYKIYYTPGSLPYIKNTKKNTRTPITKEIIKKLIIDNKIDIIKDLKNDKELKKMLLDKYKNFYTLSKITGKSKNELSKNSSFEDYINILSKNTGTRLKNLLDKKENLNYVSNTNYYKYSNTNYKYTKITIPEILNTITEIKLKDIVEGNFLVETKKNNIQILNGLKSILDGLIDILYYRENPSQNKEKFRFDKTFHINKLFILEKIYNLLCEDFIKKGINTNECKELINDILKKADFVELKSDKKNMNNKKENLIPPRLIEIEYKNFKMDEYYFYSLDNGDSILYFGRLTKIEGIFSKDYFFKYYTGADDICNEIKLKADDLKGKKFYTFDKIYTPGKDGKIEVLNKELPPVPNKKKNKSSNKSENSKQNVSNTVQNGEKTLIHNNEIIINTYNNTVEKNLGLKNCTNMCYALAAIQFLYHNNDIRNYILTLNIKDLNRNKILQNIQTISPLIKNINEQITILKCIKYIFYLFQIGKSVVDLCSNGILALLHSLTIKGTYKDQEDSSEFLNLILSCLKELKMNNNYSFVIETEYRGGSRDPKERIMKQYKTNKLTEIDDIQNICHLIIEDGTTKIGNNIQKLINNYLEPEILVESESKIDEIYYKNKIISIKKSNKYIFFSLKRFGFKIQNNKNYDSVSISDITLTPIHGNTVTMKISKNLRYIEGDSVIVISNKDINNKFEGNVSSYKDDGSITIDRIRNINGIFTDPDTFNIYLYKYVRIDNNIQINYNIDLIVNKIIKQYKLIGVICHLGASLQEGHYIYYKFTNENDMVCFNDDKVTDEKYANALKERIESQCYILAYEEITPTP